MTEKEKGTCSINPEHTYTHWGNNAEPVNSGRCCDDCNQAVVIPARIFGRTALGQALRALPSERRSETSRQNGKKGGRPTKKTPRE